MAFSTQYLDYLRKIGRKYVLPYEAIQNIIEKEVNFNQVKNIVDFGAGTLFWSDYLSKQLGGGGGNIIAIDSIYNFYTPKITSQNIKLSATIPQDLDEIDLFFTSDVLHHITESMWEDIYQKIKICKYIIIKDIDCHHKFGNFANKMHDKIINGENVRNISPHKLEKQLRKDGYEIQQFYLPKLWYPHFLLIAKKSS